jgi:hypothetical protein
VQYIRDMGVDEKLFTYMTQATKDEVNILSEDRLRELGVVSEGTGPTTWSIVSVDGGMYLKGTRNTVFGLQKLILLCAPKGSGHRLEMMAIFDPQGRESEVVRMGAVSLLLDGNRIFMPFGSLSMKPTNRNGWIDIMVPLNAQLVAKLAKAKTAGVAVQYTYEAAVFWGVADMDFTEAAKMLLGYLTPATDKPRCVGVSARRKVCPV